MLNDGILRDAKEHTDDTEGCAQNADREGEAGFGNAEAIEDQSAADTDDHTGGCQFGGPERLQNQTQYQSKKQRR